MDNVYPFAAESARAMSELWRPTIADLQGRVQEPCPACASTGSRPGIAVRPRVFPGCNRPRIPEAVAQLMVCGTCRGTGTVRAVA